MSARDLRILAVLIGCFLAAYALPLGDPRVSGAILEGFRLLQWYARNHTLACVVPAQFIAGGIMTFLSPAVVLRHLGPQANKVTAYSVASVSGTVLAVCSCSVLPMFAGIYRLGAGLGPAAAFLYSGPAINVLAIFLTARVLGVQIGLWRALGALGFAVLIGLVMAFVFRHEPRPPQAAATVALGAPAPRPLWQSALLLVAMVAFLVFSDWFNPGDTTVVRTDGTTIRGVVLQETLGDVMIQVQETTGGIRAGERLVLPKTDIAEMIEPETWVMAVYRIRWFLAGLCALALVVMCWRWVTREEMAAWMGHTWEFTKLLVPLLFGGVLLVGFLSALLPDERVAQLVGDNSLRSTLIASLVGALFYFATLTEVPITQALLEHGMAHGPALALLLAGPALSLPNMLVIARVMGARKTAVFCTVIVVAATVTGMVFGRFA